MNTVMASSPESARETIYTALDSSRLETRLCRFESTQNPCKGYKLTMKSVSLGDDAAPHYIALSYEWNPAAHADTKMTSDKPIGPDKLHLHQAQIDSMTIPITFNLGLALQNLWQLAGSVNWFWIDALCIDQSNTVEKAQQVNMMRNIYKNAQEVWVWAGVESAQTDLCPLVDIIEIAKQADARAEIKEAVLNPSMKPYWNIFNAITSSTYWSRSWIIQELVMASSLRMIVMMSDGSNDTVQTLDLNEILGFISRLRELGYPKYSRHDWSELSHGPQQFSPYLAAVVEFVRCDCDPRRNLFDVLIRFASHCAADSRDKVYSLLGIVEHAPKGHIEVSYEVSAGEVFRRAAINIIQSSSHLDILAFSGSRLEGLPSWAPDWSTVRTHMADLDRFRDGTITHSAVIHPEQGILGVEAHILGTVKPMVRLKDMEKGSGFDRAIRLMRVFALQLYNENRPLLQKVEEKIGVSPQFVRTLLWLLFLTAADSGKQLLTAEDDFVSKIYYEDDIARYTYLFGEDEDLHSLLDLHPYQPGLLTRAFSEGREFFFVNLPLNVTEYDPGSVFDKSILGEFSESIRPIVKEHLDMLWCPCMVRLGSDRPVGENDVVALIHGCRYPLLLEKVEGYRERFIVKGPAWIHRSVEKLATSDPPYQRIQLV